MSSISGDVAAAQPLLVPDACVWGRALLAQVAMVISCSHQARMAVIKVSKNPRERFAKKFLRSKNSARRAGRLTSLADWQASQALRASSASFLLLPAAPSMSSQYPHLDLRCVAQRLFARAAARVHPVADCITFTNTASCAAETLSSRKNRRPGFVAG